MTDDQNALASDLDIEPGVELTKDEEQDAAIAALTESVRELTKTVFETGRDVSKLRHDLERGLMLKQDAGNGVQLFSLQQEQHMMELARIREEFAETRRAAEGALQLVAELKGPG